MSPVGQKYLSLDTGVSSTVIVAIFVRLLSDMFIFRIFF